MDCDLEVSADTTPWLAVVFITDKQGVCGRMCTLWHVYSQHTQYEVCNVSGQFRGAEELALA